VGVQARLPRLGEDELEDRLVEVVTPEARRAGGRDDLVDAPRHVDERRIERAPAEVVHEHVLALARHRVAEAVRVFEARGGGLVQERQHLEPGAPEGLEGEEPLVVGGVGGDAERHFQGLAVLHARVRPADDVLPQVHEVRDQHVQEGQRVAAGRHLGQWPGVGQEPLERAQHDPVGVFDHGQDVLAQAHPPVALANRHEGRDHVAPLVGDHRVVPTVHERGHGVRRPEVDPQTHWSIDLNRRSAGPGPFPRTSPDGPARLGYRSCRRPTR
jgi:hypothetical protein